MAVNWAHIGDAIEKQTIQQVSEPSQWLKTIVPTWHSVSL